MKQTACLTLLLLLLLSGCAPRAHTAGPFLTDTPQNHASQTEIPFSDDQCYAVAYLGYQDTGDLDLYSQRYLNGARLPVHYLSPGDCYLIIPRYPGMALFLYRNDIASDQSVLVYSDPDCRPFVIQCNASDIFEDATIRFSWGEEHASFSPALSLKDGSVLAGPRGLVLPPEPAG